jgi:beta-glucosidase
MAEDYSRLGHLPGGLAFERAGDARIIAAPTDFLGVNYYMRAVVRSEAVAEDDNELPNVFRAPESEHTDMGWEVYPDGLRQLLVDVHSGYSPKKIYVTENGASYGDGPGSDGRVRDARRIRFLRDHLVATHRALGAGVPVAGYFVWSLLDNFEWDRGYTQRFGIVWVDYETQRRVPKDSAYWYRAVIATNAVGN